LKDCGLIIFSDCILKAENLSIRSTQVLPYLVS